jgi:hypothetical protein
MRVEKAYEFDGLAGLAQEPRDLERDESAEGVPQPFDDVNGPRPAAQKSFELQAAKFRNFLRGRGFRGS